MTPEQVEAQVESWNWNLNIFEVYDEIRDYSDRDKQKLLKHSYNFFGKDILTKELAHHFGIDIIEE